MASTAPPTSPRRQLNAPNTITAARIVLSIVLFVFLAIGAYILAIVVFVAAAVSDLVDGWWARRYNQVTQLGRILDPFADKIVVCGTYVFLAAEWERGSGIAPWMAVVILGRELLVTALRSFLEERGSDFSASLAGKWKMVFQCVAAVASMLVLSYEAGNQPPWLAGTAVGAAYVAVAATVYSGVGYVAAAARLMRGG
jgi:CDP-diacylglycerol--glycerol-3-phosphate 3-phosphatidyltransferase